MDNINIKSVKKQLIMEEVSSYQVTFSNSEVWSVPLDPDNTQYQAIQEWVKKGNKIEEAD
tara:strand:- start:200 stop:379 length:180 start_codon:yes stop_codon:yes gene_type:complete